MWLKGFKKKFPKKFLQQALKFIEYIIIVKMTLQNV